MLPTLGRCRTEPPDLVTCLELSLFAQAAADVSDHLISTVDDAKRRIKKRLVRVRALSAF